MLAEALREVQRALSALRGDLRARPSLNVEELREVVRAEVNRLMLERDITGEVMALKKQVAGIAEELERVSKALDSLGQRVAELEERLSAVEQRAAATPAGREIGRVGEVAVSGVSVRITEDMSMDELCKKGVLDKETIGNKVYYTVKPRSVMPLGPENIAAIDRIAEREGYVRTRHPINRRIAWARPVKPGEAV